MRAIPKKLPAFSAALFAVLTLIAALPPETPSVRVAGVLPLGFHVSPADRLIVDSSRNRGYYYAPSPIPTVWLLDLKRLRIDGHKRMTLPDGPVAVDVIRHKIVFAGTAQVGSGCNSSAVWMLEGTSLKLTRVPLPCDPALSPLQIDALSVDAPLSLLTLIGHRGSITVVRELKVGEDGVSLNWEVREPRLCDAVGEHNIARMRHGDAVYCSLGSSGRAIWIPTWHGVPVPDASGRSIVRITDAGTTGRFAGLDRQTGRVALTPGEGSVAVYDAPDERRVATIRPPLDARSDEVGAARHAFDPSSGRVYLLGDGVVHAADVRGDADTVMARFEMPTGFAGGDVAVDQRLHRLYLRSRDSLIALEDDRPIVESPSSSNRPRLWSTTSRIAADPSPPRLETSHQIAVIPREDGRRAGSDPTTVSDRILVAEVAELLPRPDLPPSRPVLSSSPYTLTRLRDTRVLLRAPPTVR